MNSLPKYLRIGSVILALTLLGVRAARTQSYWQHVPMPDQNSTYSYAIKASDSLDFVHLASGFLGGAELFRTQDGGQTWKRLFFGGGLFFLDAAHPTKNLIVIAADSDFSYSNASTMTYIPRYGGIIYRSSDGGNTWQTQQLGTRDTTTPANFISSMSALDSNHLFLTGESIRISSDGGLSWQTVSDPVSRTYNAIPLGIPNPIGAYPGTNVLVIAEADTFTSWNYGYKIFRSTDLGQTWSPGFQTLHSITGFAFPTPSIGFASGYTEDQSHVQTAVIDETTDGGLTWSNIYTNKFPSSTGLYSISFADSLHGIACGEYGVLIRTTNGGTTWAEENTDFSEADLGLGKLTAVAFPTLNTTIVGYLGQGALVYQPNGILTMPNVTYPTYGNSVVPCSFTAYWDPVPGADKYAVKLILEGPNTIIVDTTVSADSIYFNQVNTSSSIYGCSLYVQAISGDNKSNSFRQVFYIDPCSGSVSNDGDLGSPLQYLWVQVYPNPAGDFSHCRLNGIYADPSGQLTAELDDVLGRKVLDLTGLARAGNNGSYSDFVVDASTLSAGVYMIRYTLGSYSSGRLVAIIH